MKLQMKRDGLHSRSPLGVSMGSDSIQVSPAAIRNSVMKARLNLPNWSGEVSEKSDTPRMASAGVGRREEGGALGTFWIDIGAHSQILSTMMRMTNAFIMGKSEAVIAENIFVSSCTRPNSLTIRKALINRTSQSGILKGPKSKKDMSTTNKSSQLHPLLANFKNQFENMLMASSRANISVKA
jgi:hypothetical protein